MGFGQAGKIFSGVLLAFSFTLAYADDAFSASDISAISARQISNSKAYTQDVMNLQAESQKKAAAYTTLASFLQNTALQNSGANTAKDADSGVIVFVSLGMPVLSLRQIITDADRLHIPVVVRGVLNNDFKASAKVLYDVLHPPGEDPLHGGVEIDPVWFEGFGIAQVPAVVAVPAGVSCTDKTPCTADQFDVLYGNVPIEEALTRIAKNGGVGGSVAASVLAGGDHHAN